MLVLGVGARKGKGSVGGENGLAYAHAYVPFGGGGGSEGKVGSRAMFNLGGHTTHYTLYTITIIVFLLFTLHVDTIISIIIM